MNLLMIAPLCDSRGKIRYHIGAQVDVSGLAKDCTDLESLQRLVAQEDSRQDWMHSSDLEQQQEKGDEFKELSEMLNMGELETVRKCGGRMHREQQDEEETESAQSSNGHRPRIVLEEPTTVAEQAYATDVRGNGRLSGIYQHGGRSSLWVGTFADSALVPPHPTIPIAPNSLCLSHPTCAGHFTGSVHEQDRRIRTRA